MRLRGSKLIFCYFAVVSTEAVLPKAASTKDMTSGYMYCRWLGLLLARSYKRKFLKIGFARRGRIGWLVLSIHEGEVSNGQ